VANCRSVETPIADMVIIMTLITPNVAKSFDLVFELSNRCRTLSLAMGTSSFFTLVP
jgi:hypothetical protein